MNRDDDVTQTLVITVERGVRKAPIQILRQLRGYVAGRVRTAPAAPRDDGGCLRS